MSADGTCLLYHVVRILRIAHVVAAQLTMVNARQSGIYFFILCFHCSDTAIACAMELLSFVRHYRILLRSRREQEAWRNFDNRWFMLRETVESFLLFPNDALLTSTLSFPQLCVAR